nr:MAG TPA: defensin [Caudoviricetes sp.]
MGTSQTLPDRRGFCITSRISTDSSGTRNQVTPRHPHQGRRGATP